MNIIISFGSLFFIWLILFRLFYKIKLIEFLVTVVWCDLIIYTIITDIIVTHVIITIIVIEIIDIAIRNIVNIEIIIIIVWL